MAAVKHAKGVALVVKIGNGADPEVFTPLCSINAARGISFTGAMNEIAVPDCTDLDKIAWLAREMTSLSVNVTGAGLLNTSDVQSTFDWWKSGESKNLQVIVDVPSSAGGVVFEGAYKLPEFALNGEPGDKQQFTCSLASDGEVTCTANT